jgi:hypothetical protein
MDPKLKAILQKAKAIDEKAKQYDTVDRTVLENNVKSRAGGDSIQPSQSSSLYDQMGTTQTAVMSETSTQVKPNINPNSGNYNQRVKESKLPPEIMQAMLENPIPQPDMPGTFSMDEEAIKEINPNYGKKTITESPINNRQNIKPTKSSTNIDKGVVRKMIAEEIAKALPSIVEKYFDKKMIQENVKMLKSLKVKGRKS